MEKLPSRQIIRNGILDRRPPPMAEVPLSVGRAWRGGNALYQEKTDGEWMIIANGPSPIAKCPLVAERLRPKSGGLFTSVDRVLLARYGQMLVVHDIAAPGLTTRERWRILRRWWRDESIVPFRDGIPVRLCFFGNGGKFLEKIIAAGGEGVVAKPWDSFWGEDWLKCKARQTFYCRVTRLAANWGSVAVVRAPDWLDGSGPGVEAPGPETWIPLRGGKFEQVRIGSILKLNALGVTAAGCLREARLDADRPESWRATY